HHRELAHDLVVVGHSIPLIRRRNYLEAANVSTCAGSITDPASERNESGAPPYGGSFGAGAAPLRGISVDAGRSSSSRMLCAGPSMSSNCPLSDMRRKIHAARTTIARLSGIRR